MMLSYTQAKAFHSGRLGGVKFTETIACDGSIEFYGMMGNLVYSTTITKGVDEMQININSLNSGLYFYSLKLNNNKITSGKITIVNK